MVAYLYPKPVRTQLFFDDFFSTFVNRFPVRYDDSMNTVLTQELVRFNALVNTVCSTLNNLLLALKGSVLMSADLDDVANSLRSR